MSFTFYLRYVVSDKSYSLFKSIAWYIITLGKSKKGLMWYRKNPIYIAQMLLILVLCLINLTLMGQLIHSDILTRPILNLMLSPIAWALVYITKYFDRKKYIL